MHPPQDLYINESYHIPVQLLEMRAVRSSGPGGQHVNKVSTKVELHYHIHDAFHLPYDIVSRIVSYSSIKFDVDAYDSAPGEISAPEYVDPADQAPLIGANCNVTLANFFENINAVSKVAIDTGWQLNDVGDTRETFGMGIAFINLATYPTITLTVADLAEGAPTQTAGDPPVTTNTGREPDWTDAQSNFINPNLLTLTLGVGTSSIVWQLANPQLIAWPTPGDENGYRNNSLTFGGVPSSTNQTVMAMTFVDATEAP